MRQVDLGLDLVFAASGAGRPRGCGRFIARARRRLRTSSASCSSRELECVFFSVTPTSCRTSRIALLLTSSSRARSLIRTLLIRSRFLRPVPAKFSSQPHGFSVNCSWSLTWAVTIAHRPPSLMRRPMGTASCPSVLFFFSGCLGRRLGRVRVCRGVFCRGFCHFAGFRFGGGLDRLPQDLQRTPPRQEPLPRPQLAAATASPPSRLEK